MNKLYKYMLLILFLLIPGKVFAESNIIINCNSNYVAGTILECSLIANVDEGITYDRVESSVSVANNETIAFTNAQNLTGTLQNNKLSIKSDKEVGSVTTLGTLKIKFPISTSGEKEIKLQNIKFYKDNSEVLSLNSADSIVKVASSVNTLESLSVDECNDCKLSPSFDKDTTIYVVITNSNKIKINATASGNANVTGAGEKALTKDNETFNIVVTAESGDMKTYKITVIKQETKSNDNSLKSLKVDGSTLSPTLANNTTTYRAQSTKDKVVISAECNDNLATVVGTGEKSLKLGENKFDVIVTAQDGTTKNYSVIIDRINNEEKPKLKSLIINGEEMNLAEGSLNYTYRVNSLVQSLDIEALGTSEDYTIEIDGNDELVDGENIVTVTVIDTNNVKTIYTITVIKDTDTSLGLSDLTVEGYNINFDKEVLEYNITINGEESLNINAVPTSEDYSVEITGNSNLKDGSTIRIVVTDASFNTKVYTINVAVNNTQLNSNTDTSDINYIPIIMTGLLVLLFIIDLILLIQRIKKK